MVTEDEYRALAAAYQRLQEDYDDLEQEKPLKVWKEKCLDLEEQIQKSTVQYQEERVRNETISACIVEREHHLKTLESRLMEYIEQSEILETAIQGYRDEIKKHQGRIAELEQWSGHLQSLSDDRLERIQELEQWSGHLQSLCDERLARIRRLEDYVHHPFANIGKLIRVRIGRKKEQ